MGSKKLSQTILEAERIGIILYVVLIIIGAATVLFIALTTNNLITAFKAGLSFITGAVVLSIIIYLETQVWDSE